MRSDSTTWCAPKRLEDGRTIYGGAARNVRLKDCGGVNAIIESAILHALDKSEKSYTQKSAANDNVFPLKKKKA